jgi:hypothetical protein
MLSDDKLSVSMKLFVASAWTEVAAEPGGSIETSMLALLVDDVVSLQTTAYDAVEFGDCLAAVCTAANGLNEAAISLELEGLPLKPGGGLATTIRDRRQRST